MLLGVAAARPVGSMVVAQASGTLVGVVGVDSALTVAVFLKAVFVLETLAEQNTPFVGRV